MIKPIYLLVIVITVADVGKGPELAGGIEQRSGRTLTEYHDYLVYKAARFGLLPCLAAGHLDDPDRERQKTHCFAWSLRSSSIYRNRLKLKMLLEV